MIERYNAENGGVERIDDGAPTFQIPVFFNGIPNGDTVEAEVLIRDVNPCYDVVVMPKNKPHTFYPGTVGWMYDGRTIMVDGKALRVFDRCETMDTYDRLSV